LLSAPEFFGVGLALQRFRNGGEPGAWKHSLPGSVTLVSGEIWVEQSSLVAVALFGPAGLQRDRDLF